jgi:hypothetical protein
VYSVNDVTNHIMVILMVSFVLNNARMYTTKIIMWLVRNVTYDMKNGTVSS